jgi:signal peptidase I
MNLDQWWKIAALIGLLAFLRIVWGLWRSAPYRKFMVELLDSGLIAFILVFVLIRPFVVQAFYIPSESMDPTLKPGDRILVNKFVYRLNPPQRGDVIVFDAPEQALEVGEGQKDFVKRLIGLPGDRIAIREGEGVFIKPKGAGKELRFQEAPGVPLPGYTWDGHHPYEDHYLWTGDHYSVQPGSYFVLGDNRNRSNDSHKWLDPVTRNPAPALEQGRVLGKAMVIFWPPQRIGLVSDHARAHLGESPGPLPERVASARR